MGVSNEVLSKFDPFPGDGLGWVKDEADDRDFLYEASGEPLPVKAVAPNQFRTNALGSVVNQDGEPSCVAYSGDSISQHLNIENPDLARSLALGIDASEMYAECKKRDGIPNIPGTYIRVCASIAVERGFLVRPIPATRTLPAYPGGYVKFGSYTRIRSIQDMKDAIFTNGPVWFGMAVDDGIYDATYDRPRLPEPTGNVIGGHAMVAVGYSDTAGGFWVKNSWGNHYGRLGYCRIPYSWFEMYSDFDAWICTA